MRLVFAGTPEFAARALGALHSAGHEVALVLTQPDRPSGRGLKLKPSAVAELATALRLPVAKPGSLKSAEAVAAIAAAAPEAMIVAAYGLILPGPVLSLPSKGCLNIHASLLPRWRGAAPVQRAILSGDSRTGVTIMAMEAGLDTGPALLRRPVPILATDTAASLTEKLADLGAAAIVEALDRLESLRHEPQDESAVTYAPKIAKSEAPLDWRSDALALERQVRAFNPFPVAETLLHGQKLKVWEARVSPREGPAGTVVAVDEGIPVVACGKGALALTVVQSPGSRRMAAAEFLKGHPVAPGTRLGSPLAGHA